MVLFIERDHLCTISNDFSHAPVGGDAVAEEQLAADPDCGPRTLVFPIADAFGVRVHPRSIERALARRRRRSKSR
jgi:hypothetical protein